MSSDQRARPFDLGALIAGSSLVFGIATAGLLVAGWSYARTYLGNFQLGLEAIDLSYESLLLYGFWVAKSSLPWLLTIASVLVGIGLWRPWRSIRGHSALAILLGLLTLIPAFIAVDFVARTVAGSVFAEEQRQAFPYHRRVKVFIDPPRKVRADAAEKDSVKKGASQPISNFPEDLDQGGYRLLIKDNDMLIVFRPVKDLKSVPPTVFAMPWSRVAGFWIMDDSSSCA
jgi:hypothetical protein